MAPHTEVLLMFGLKWNEKIRNIYSYPHHIASSLFHNTFE
jgi:hypothetical protein